MHQRLYWTLLATILVACSGDPQDTRQATPAADEAATLDPAKDIDWFEGSVEEAFAAASESGKPIYLYWGAVWCPPCHAINATIFNRPEFIERSRLFIPVYLDGDTENAQAYGEKFGVLGYPTMIVFDAGGTEMTRIPGGIDLQAYANILDLTLSQASSAGELVDTLAEGAGTLAAGDCTLLAYYSWGQDTRILKDRDRAATFRQMYEACPESMATERSILYFAWLDAAIAAASDGEEATTLRDDQIGEALGHVNALINDDRLIKANIFTVLMSGADHVKALTVAGSEQRAELVAGYQRAYDRIAADESIYKRERIYTLAGRIGFERIDDAEVSLSASLQDKIRDMVKWADESTPSVYERQPIINALGNVLEEAGMDDVAKPLLLAEVGKSMQPYYFMVGLADIEQRAGNTDAAIDWLKQAYDSARGPATRFQWGYYYLNGLIEMTPDDTRRIHDTTVGLIDELQNSGGLYHRPKAQLARIEEKLRDWGKAYGHADELARIRASVAQVCAGATQQGASRATCDAFLAQA